MSLQQLAQHLQSQGRGNDKMLIHMTPQEVGGLQSLAMAHGGSLTINPQTGLPEAGFLEKILPTVIGAGVGIATMNPMLGAAAGGAAGMAMNKGSLQAGIMAGLSSYGFGSLGVGLAGAGAATGFGAAGITPEATATAVNAYEAALPGMGSEVIGAGGATGTGAMAPMGTTPGLSSVPKASVWDNLGAGFKNVSASPGGIGGFLKDNISNIGMGVAPLFLTPTDQQNQNKQPDSEGEIRPYTYTQTQNPNFGAPGQPYYNQSFTPGTPVPASQFTGFNSGGIVALADGGISGPYTRPTRTVDPTVTAYNTELMNRAAQEYVNSPQLGAFQSALPNAGNYNPAAGQAFQAQQAKLAADRAANPPQPGVGGYTFDQATGRFTKTGPSPEEASELQRQIDELRSMQNGQQNQGSYYGNLAAGGLAQTYADGGISTLGSYSDGGRLLKGPGDGVSDNIPAQIGEKQPARLADGEFVVPARIVSEIGNGSTDAGAKRLYQMMDRVQKARKKSVGKDKVAVDSKAYKHLPV